MMDDEERTGRYRKAAGEALDQLSWCVEYLRGIRKTRESRQLARNRAAIQRRVRAADQETRSAGDG